MTKAINDFNSPALITVDTIKEDVLVDGIQNWGQAASWNICTDFPGTIAIQTKDNENLYEIVKLGYENQNVRSRATIGYVNKCFINISNKIENYGDYSSFNRA